MDNSYNRAHYAALELIKDFEKNSDVKIMILIQDSSTPEHAPTILYNDPIFNGRDNTTGENEMTFLEKSYRLWFRK